MKDDLGWELMRTQAARAERWQPWHKRLVRWLRVMQVGRGEVGVWFKGEHWKDVKCRFGCESAAVIVHVPEGCICWRDPVQALCMQHLVTAESTGDITVLFDFRPLEHRKL